MSAGGIEFNSSTCLAWSCGGGILYNHDSSVISELQRFCVAARNSCICCVGQSLSSVRGFALWAACLEAT